MGNAESSSSELNQEDGESRSVPSSLVAGATVAGTALLALGAWKLATSSPRMRRRIVTPIAQTHGTRTVKFMTYNLWIQEISLDRRMKAIGQLIEKHSPDVIMFQEVTPNMIKKFQNSEWRMDYNYILPEFPPANRGSFCIMMSNVPMEAKLIELDELDESKFRVASVNVMGRSLLLATCHLKSNVAPKNSSRNTRRNQADELLHKFPPCPNVVLGGDMNWNEDLIADLPFPWVDAWIKLRPEEPGYTYDTVRNKMIANNNIVQKRLDRFVCKLQDFKLEDIEIIGTEAIDGEQTRYRDKDVPLFPSDHFGLVLTISAK